MNTNGSDLRKEACTCELERDFGYVEEFGVEGKWEVIDAECVVVATCSSRRFARLVAWALNKAPEADVSYAGGEICLVHT